MYATVVSDNTVSVFIEGHLYQTDKSNPNWDRIVQELHEHALTAEELIALIRPVHAVAAAVSGVQRIQLIGNTLTFDGQVLDTVLAHRIVEIVGLGLPFEGWLRFAENVYANPAEFSREELYLFLEKNDLPITPDGCFIAYKVVRGDYTDTRTGRMDNSIGKTVVMPGGRQAVDPVRDRTCSYGLHFCSKEYLPHFGAGGGGEHVLLVKINPADVVSIPNDYNNAKGRTWRYEVVGEITREQAGLHKWAPVASGFEDHDWDIDPDEDFEFDADDVDDFEVEEVHTVEPVVRSSVLGDISRDRFTALLADHGSQAAVARAVGVSAGTVQTWRVKLFGDE